MKETELAIRRNEIREREDSMMKWLTVFTISILLIATLGLIFRDKKIPTKFCVDLDSVTDIEEDD